MLHRFLDLPHPGLGIYKKCIEMELNLASAGDKDCLVRARKICESALSAYCQDVSLWQDYYFMESKVERYLRLDLIIYIYVCIYVLNNIIMQQMGTSETAAAVHWRARKALGGNVSFQS